MTLNRTIVPGLLAGSLLLGGASGVFASKTTKGAHRAVLIGQVSNLSTSGFTLTWTPRKAGSTSKSIAVSIAAATKERGLKGAAALANGDYAFVAGTRAAGTVAARRVVYSTTALTAAQIQTLRGVRVRGTLVSSPAGQLVVTVGTKGRTITFNLSTTTRYRVNKQLTATEPAFTAGEKVVVRFTRAKGATKGSVIFTATAVIVPAKQS